MRLALKHVRECVDLRRSAHELSEHSTVLFPGVAERQEDGAVVPADEPAGHSKRRTIAVETASFVEHVKSLLDIVEDDDGLPKRADVHNAPYTEAISKW